MGNKKAKTKAKKPSKKQTKEIAVRSSQVVERADTGGKLIDLAIRRDFDVDRLEKLIALQERQEMKEAKRDFDIHFARLQSKIQPVVRNKTATNRDGSKMYGWASIAQIQKTFGRAIADEGFSSFWRRPVIDHQTHWVAVTHVLSGYGFEKETTHEGPILQPTDRQNVLQALEGTITYLRRYSLKDGLGIVDDEDDRDGAGTVKVEIVNESSVVRKETQDFKLAHEALRISFRQLSASGLYKPEELDKLEEAAKKVVENGITAEVKALKKAWTEDLFIRKNKKKGAQ